MNGIPISKIHLPASNTSTLIKSLKYSAMEWQDKYINQIITVYFNDGAEIEYLVGENGLNVYNDFKNASSLGKHWHKFIKDKFQFKIIKKGKHS